jgi:hypothetical protein
MKTSAYMDRALKARDPRFARILGKLGYNRRDMQAVAAGEMSVNEARAHRDMTPVETEEDIADVRAEYQEVVGKRAYPGWDIPTLRQKMAEAKGE